MREAENIFQLSRTAVDEIGVIFFEGSARFVGDAGIASIFLRQVTQKTVGVFVNSTYKYIHSKVTEFSLDKVQLHGDESPEFCERVQTLDVEVVKVFKIKTKKDLEDLEKFKDVVDLFLFDTKGEKEGGNGYTFDWSILKSIDIPLPFMLSGGIGVQHIEELKQLNLKNCIGFDVNSQFEEEPGVKDIKKITHFINSLKNIPSNDL